MAADNRSPARPRHPAEMGLIARALHGAVKLAAWLVAALLFSILIEWAGMLLVWRGEGAGHSRAMLAQELAWLPAELRESLLVSSPARFARHLSQGLYHYASRRPASRGCCMRSMPRRPPRRRGSCWGCGRCCCPRATTSRPQ